MHLTNQIKRAIANREFVPNAPATIRKKKSSTPLVDTGQLRASITYQRGNGDD